MIHIVTRTAVNRLTNVMFWMDGLALALFGLRADHQAESEAPRPKLRGSLTLQR
jgi:hypothetical protein